MNRMGLADRFLVYGKPVEIRREPVAVTGDDLRTIRIKPLAIWAGKARSID